MSFLKPSRLKASFKSKDKDQVDVHPEPETRRGSTRDSPALPPSSRLQDDTHSYQEIIRTSSKRTRARPPPPPLHASPTSARRDLLTPLATTGLRSQPSFDDHRLHPHSYPYSNPSYPVQASATPSSSSRQRHDLASSSTSPTSPTSPVSPATPASAGTKAAHYYPYTASSRHGPGTTRQQERSASIASPGSFRSRGSEAVRELAAATAKTASTNVDEPSLPPGARAPRPPESVRSHPSYTNLAPQGSRSSASRSSPPRLPPPPPLPYPHHPPPPHRSYSNTSSQPTSYPYASHPHAAPYPTPPPSSSQTGSFHQRPPPPPLSSSGYSQSRTRDRAPESASIRSHHQPPPTLYPSQSYLSQSSAASWNRSTPFAAPPPPPSSSSAAYYNPQYGSSAANAVARNIEREKERIAAIARDRERERERTRQPSQSAGGRDKQQQQTSKTELDKAKDKENAEGKLSVGIDFGTTFSGIAYGSSRLFAGQIRQILSWPGSYETYRKVPTCILYEQLDPSQEAKIVSWGLEAKNATVTKGLIKCEWFKLLLSPESLRSGVPDPWLPPLPVGKNVVDVIADFLRCIWRYAKRTVTEEIGSVVDLNAADVLLTVPSGWDAAACSLMRESAIRAGLVQSSRGGDVNWRDRLQIITEPEAGAIHASTLATLHHLRPSQSFLLCDAGGGTVDTAVYKLMGQLSELEIAEMCVRSGSNTGSLFVDLKFEELLRRILKDHPVHLEPASMATFLHSFSETDKIAYHGTAEDDDAIFRFNCFNVEDSHDPAVGLEFGELAISGRVLKTEVFDPVIEQVIDLLSAQIAKIGQTPLDAIILVGGFAASEYLYTRVRQAFGAIVPVIVRPQDCDTATLRGAARYGLGLRMGRGAVSSVISPRSYCMKSKLPAEEEDHWRRPEFISVNDGGTVVCENRLSYLIAKGAVLRKGERLRSRFCKFVKDPRDSIFTAHLFVSDSEDLYRYTDEGDMKELCRWTVDLAALPRFHLIANEGGGYVEFDLGLMLDSAEVRGVLMTEDGVECGAATFEFLGA
ncbi:Hsp70 family protein [Sporobolomyces koalae]|uniref:Hsp70 family protein n=1 Tax=Sporobolomyces koalae TaxID=500713 RepID=UPI0031734231